jgi:hypothetical protein
LYAAIFVFLVALQFAKRTNFTMQTGSLVVQGHYADSAGAVLLPNTYPLAGSLSVFFGGMEFQPEDAELLTVADNGVYVKLASGPELSFITRYSGGAMELLISLSDDDISENSIEGEGNGEGKVGEVETEQVDGDGAEKFAVELPYKPLRTSKAEEKGGSVIYTANGTNYAFARRPGDKAILFDKENPTVSYRAIPDRRSIQPEDFILASAQNPAEFDSSVTLWRDKSFSAWNRIAGTADSGRVFSGDGEMANAYLSEAIRRGTYKAAQAAVQATYNPQTAPETRSFEPSAYAGKLDAALRSLLAAEREKYTRLARLFNERSMDFLKEYRVIEYLGARGYSNLLDDAVEMLRTFDPAAMTADQSAGFLEGFLDWEKARPGRENPYSRFMDQAFFVISGSMRKNQATGAALVFTGEYEGFPSADMELCLRIGSALSRLPPDEKTEKYAALGKTIILSALSLSDESGGAPRTVLQQNDGSFISRDSDGRLSPGRIYRIAYADNPEARAQAGSDYYARAKSLAAQASLWTWTVSPAPQARQANGILDISVNFPAGETHFLLIRNVRPFIKLQLWGLDYPSDPQFERYDFPGWAYSAQDQTLLVKMKHRGATEHIMIFYTDAAAEGQ